MPPPFYREIAWGSACFRYSWAAVHARGEGLATGTAAPSFFEKNLCFLRKSFPPILYLLVWLLIVVSLVRFIYLSTCSLFLSLLLLGLISLQVQLSVTNAIRNLLSGNAALGAEKIIGSGVILPLCNLIETTQDAQVTLFVHHRILCFLLLCAFFLSYFLVLPLLAFRCLWFRSRSPLSSAVRFSSELRAN
jgi:hypothetical protein